MVIKTVSERGSSGDGFTVRLSDGSSFFVSAAFLGEHGLEAGMEVSDELGERLAGESERVQALLKAGELLARAEQSSGGLLQKLVKKGFSETAARNAVSRVRELGLLDDGRFARFWIESRLRQHPEGRNLLYGGLMKRGVSSDAAKEALDEILSEDILCDAVMKAGRKLSSRTKGDELKLKQSLLRRGFSSSEIRYYFNHREI